MTTILLAYDDTDSGDAALQRAAELTARLDAQLVVTTVVPTVVSTIHAGGLNDPVDTPARRNRVLTSARAYLTAHRVEARYVLSIGHPADAIVSAADTYGADLIVVGRRRHNPIKRLLGDNVSESVLHKAHCTVLLAHAQRRAASERLAA